MRIYDEKTVKEEVIVDVVCDVCGKKIEKDRFGHVNDYVHIEKLWGYNSRNDGMFSQLDICEDCFLKLKK